MLESNLYFYFWHLQPANSVTGLINAYLEGADFTNLLQHPEHSHLYEHS